MQPLHRIAAWLNIRPDEIRPGLLLFASAFCILAFVVLSRSLREAFYLASFDVRTLPYMTTTVAALAIPTVMQFIYLLSRYSAGVVLNRLLPIVAVGITLLGLFVRHSEVAIVLFYLWTALGVLLITSGFWLVTADYFVLREAKRLFGFIGAGGALGAVVAGTSLPWLSGRFSSDRLVLGLLLFLFLSWICHRSLPTKDRSPADYSRSGSSSSAKFRESVALIWQKPYLRVIAGIVMVATVASTILDYQFKEFVQASLLTRAQLTSFFGLFYGWIGVIAFVLQLTITSRFLAFAGVAVSLSLLPLVLLLGSSLLLVLPGLLVATMVRGADRSLRTSIHIAVIEFCYVPLSSSLRRKTKTFIDAIVDTLSEGLGAVMILLWVTLAGLPSRWLSFFVGVLSVVFLYLNRLMGKQYFLSLGEQLKRGKEATAELVAKAKLGDGRLVTMSLNFTHLDIAEQLKAHGVDMERLRAEQEPTTIVIENPPVQEVIAILHGNDMAAIVRLLESYTDWEPEHIPCLVRFLTRDALYPRVRAILENLGDMVVTPLTEQLINEEADFVIRRRIPAIFAKIGGAEVDDALLDALHARRFEIRYRAAIALVRRRRDNRPLSQRDWHQLVYEALRAEVNRGRPVWELQRLLDADESDDLLHDRVGLRGEISLEHTFRLLTLVLDPDLVRAAFHGIILDEKKLKSFSLEYLEHVLPHDIRTRLWPFIGDISDHRQRKSRRPINEVVADLIKTGASLFGSEQAEEALRRVLEKERKSSAK